MNAMANPCLRCEVGNCTPAASGLLLVDPQYYVPLWRNGIARWTSNSEVVGSSPISGVVIRCKSHSCLIVNIFKIDAPRKMSFALSH